MRDERRIDMDDYTNIRYFLVGVLIITMILLNRHYERKELARKKIRDRIAELEEKYKREY